VNFAQLEYFLAVARFRSFCHAAESAYVSQSALSKQIKAMEEELGTELFIRGSTGVSLTPAGETFLRFASSTSVNYENVLARLAQYSDSAQIRVRVGALPLTSAYDLVSDLADFQADNMGVQIDLYERNQEEILKRLELHRLDVAILRTDLLSADEYDCVPLVRDEIVIVCSNEHPLARQRRVSIEELKDTRFVMLEEHSGVYTAFVEECGKHGFFPNVTFTHARHEPLIAVVTRNIGVTALPRGLTHGRNESLITCVPLQEPLYTMVGLVIPKDRALTPIAERLVRHFAGRYDAPLETWGRSPGPDRP
jgi:LysR family transcriptional activator of glutamate synthase operon